jgi:outer membrane biosynthesis protein TonB
VLLSVSLHTVLLGAAWLVGLMGYDEIEFVTYQMELVTEADLDAIDSPPLVETPNVTPLRPEPEPEPEIPEPDPEPDVETEPPDETEPEPASEPEPEVAQSSQPVSEETDASPPASTEEMAVRMEGLRRDYPQYYNQIVREITRCFRWNGGGSWRTVIQFEISSDGRIADSTIQVYSPSASLAFDIEAYGAVACAGSGRLGALPDELPFEALSVQFTFQPT